MLAQQGFFADKTAARIARCNQEITQRHADFTAVILKHKDAVLLALTQLRKNKKLVALRSFMLTSQIIASAFLDFSNGVNIYASGVLLHETTQSVVDHVLKKRGITSIPLQCFLTEANSLCKDGSCLIPLRYLPDALKDMLIQMGKGLAQALLAKAASGDSTLIAQADALTTIFNTFLDNLLSDLKQKGEIILTDASIQPVLDYRDAFMTLAKNPAFKRTLENELATDMIPLLLDGLESALMALAEALFFVPKPE